MDENPKLPPTSKAVDPLTIERLREEMFEGLWADLAPHAERDAILLVDLDLDLAKVALGIALDQKDDVAAWIAASKIKRPSASQLSAWSLSPDHLFRFIIVAPYVLIQDLAN